MPVSPYSLKTSSDILNAALTREKEAYEFYREALKHVINNEPLRELLETLKGAEYKHIDMVEQMLAKMRLGISIL